MYATALAAVESRLGVGVTTDRQLDVYGRLLFPGNSWGGVHMADERPPLGSKYFIMNVDKRGQGGTHLVAVARGPNGQRLLYDSFGRTSKRLMPDYYHARPQDGGSRYVEDADRDVEQADSQANCGQRCLAWLLVADRVGLDAAAAI
jgi:hypothetical protein